MNSTLTVGDARWNSTNGPFNSEESDALPDP